MYSHSVLDASLKDTCQERNMCVSHTQQMHTLMSLSVTFLSRFEISLQAHKVAAFNGAAPDPCCDQMPAVRAAVQHSDCCLQAGPHNQELLLRMLASL